MARKLPGDIRILRRKNMGASFSTNEAVKLAKGYWIRLLDGDDLVTYKSTHEMLYLARANKVSFVYGLISEHNIKQFNEVYNFIGRPAGRPRARARARAHRQLFFKKFLQRSLLRCI